MKREYKRVFEIKIYCYFTNMRPVESCFAGHFLF